MKSPVVEVVVPSDDVAITWNVFEPRPQETGAITSIVTVEAWTGPTKTVFAVLVSVLLKNAPAPPTVIIELPDGGVEPLSPNP